MPRKAAILSATPGSFETLAMMPQMITPESASRFLNVSYRSVIRMIERGEISAARVGRQYRISRDELARVAGLADAGLSPVA